MKMVSLLRCFLIFFLLRQKEADGRAVNYEYEDDDDDWAWTLDHDLERGDHDLEHQQQVMKRHERSEVSERQRQRQRRVEEAEDAGWLGLGVLSDMQQFFDNLKTNLDALETIPPDDKDSLLGKQATAPQATAAEKERHFRPSATAAYLHALRNHRPSYKIRNFVESPEPVSLRGTNRYDPSLLWTGLGRRRR